MLRVSANPAHLTTMPRSTADATRFTSTGPYASSKFTSYDPTARASTVQISNGAPEGETPQQKIARLREAARRAKAGQTQGTAYERIVSRGRIWADRAHRITALGLIGFTGEFPTCLGLSIIEKLVLYE